MTTEEEFGRSLIDEDEVVPRPGALIESLRSFGYSPATAIADLIDNSITAGANAIEVDFNWDGPGSAVTILDDGYGMDESTLRNAMRAGSSNPLDARDESDLGRFGLGLKTASFSQARSLTVASKTDGNQTVAVRRWDLDYVGQTDSWTLLKSPPPAAEPELERLDRVSHGTLTIWNKLDRIVDDRAKDDDRARKAWFALVDGVRKHLEMVFHKFIEDDDLEIKVNGQTCIAWDPFLTSHRETKVPPCEDKALTLPDGTEQTLRIQPYILPHKSHLPSDEHKAAAGPRGWNQQQGFYLYRARRLIVAGDWFNPQMKPEEHHKLARIRVEITQAMDANWNLDVRKSRARPPTILREDFLRIARATREEAEAVYRHRGKRAVGGTARRQITPVWQAHSDGETVQYAINRDHPLLSFFLDAITGTVKRRASTLLRLFERNVPVAHILSQGFQDEDKLPAPETEVGADVAAMAKEVFHAMVAAGHSEEAARSLLKRTQPFDNVPEIIEALEIDE